MDPLREREDSTELLLLDCVSLLGLFLFSAAGTKALLERAKKFPRSDGVKDAVDGLFVDANRFFLLKEGEKDGPSSRIIFILVYFQLALRTRM